jgi:rhodanese-related sulfurtransferase
MNIRPCTSLALIIVFFVGSLFAETITSAGAPVQAGKSADQISRITAEELKSKLSRNEGVTILDVRDTDGYVNSNDRIKGSIHVKVRRLQSRLTLPPLGNVSRDTEVVTYCACPHDEASIRAAQILLDAGFKHVRVLDGGWQSWVRANGQVEKRPKA